MRIRSAAVIACVVVVGVAQMVTASAASPSRHTESTMQPSTTQPSATQFTQVTADPPIAPPATTSCTEHVVVNHMFQSSYYQPAFGTLTPPADCPAPWSLVVVSFTASVGGVQFDRLADVYVGDTNVFSTSTSEPCCTPGATVNWTWQKDVSEYSPLFTQSQTVTVILNNVNDSTYTGVYDVSVDFTFYETGTGAPEAAHPDQIVPVTDLSNSGGDGFYTLTSGGQVASQAVTFPRNLRRLSAELFAQGHGPCEEFWWADPAQCGVSTPYREVTIAIDGSLAGAAPVYPVVFTGGDGPGLWEPIPSPRAWNLRPYVVDLTPFAGLLTDGAPHTIAIGVIDAAYASGDYWLVGANLLAWVDQGSTQTTGGLDSSSAPAAPTESAVSDPSGNSAGETFSAQHALSWSGHVQTSAGTESTSVQESLSDST
ncbi:MAG: hypothetical protein JOY80_11820, partial [Candidatus Dormibacteraeota bacterium]|nr:hypothetical protein [Candidatus Dormibacteraeota bacterium]